MLEIERKFLVSSSEYKNQAYKSTRIKQGFLSTDPERTVRVRIKGDIGFLTIKGITNNSGTSRFEWEKEIPVSEAESLLKICHEGIIDKIRYEVNVTPHTFEIDEFEGCNKGLIIAEIELTTEDESYEKPHWVGKEVSNDNRFFNVYLETKPFKTW